MKVETAVQVLADLILFVSHPELCMQTCLCVCVVGKIAVVQYVINGKIENQYIIKVDHKVCLQFESFLN